MLKCKNCGGKVVFNVPKQKLECEYCSSEFDVQNYSENNNVDELNEYEASYYICPHCGAEQTATDETLVCYCDYCGNEMVIQGRVLEAKPSGIVPFHVSRQQGQDIYRNAIKGKFYVPKEYKDEQRISEFRGVYIPYYGFQMEIDGNPTVKVTETRGDMVYEYRRTYQISNNKGEYVQDASADFNDTISENIMDKALLGASVPFHEGYLAGFYADRADIPPQIYQNDLRERVKSDIAKSVDGVVENWHQIGIKPQTVTKKLFPVWFLTLRNKDRVAYIVENGHNGKLTADIPVDRKKFFLVSLGISAVLFLVLYFLLTMTAVTAMNYSVLLGAVASIFYRRELKNLQRKERREEDIGYQYKTTGNIVERRRQTVSKRNSGSGWSTIIIAFAATPFIAMAVSLFREAFSTNGMFPFVADLLLAACVIAALPPILRLQRPTFAIPAILLLVCAAFALFLNAHREPYDLYYYIITMAVLLSVFWETFELISIYNLQTTRPMPGFYDRKGGKNDAQD